MKIPPESESSCPSFEELSALADGETVSQSVRDHIGTCPECRKKLEEIHVLAARIASAYPEPDADYAEATLKKVRRTLKKERISPAEKNLFSRPAFWIRAAVLMILAGSFAAYFLQNRPASRETVWNVPEKVNAAAQTPAVLKQGPGRSAGVDVSDLSAVSFGPADRIPAGPGRKNTPPAAIAPRVKHIWSVPAGFSGDDLKSLLAGIRKTSVSTSQKGVLNLELATDKVTLVRMVRKFHGAGLKLLSPDQPQPEQEYFTGSESDPVFYSGELIPEKNNQGFINP